MTPYKIEEYARAFQALAPQGFAWDWRSGTTMHKVLRGLASAYHASDNEAIRLLVTSFPKTATSFLPEWEATLGLPDKCMTAPPDTLPKRQGIALAKLLRTGGQSKNYFIALAAETGYQVTITEFRQTRAGLSVCGHALNGEAWPFVWRMHAGKTVVLSARAGGSYCGDPLRAWGDKQLECQFNQIAPSHTILQVGYDQ
ncbi:YmfQ family protein [Arsenophonus nasoniae]|uniref:DUF2313 domain-containing protein n=2 Tax=Arsenophonus nasoniae TaxID=638 RepID=A0AA95GQ58_9GAMM|nr:putative phage tail protein [Arsenophonus nasoniae]WGM00945.1 DUF2313 domain-containing protein [Arsenophonus nasoniae]